MDNFNNNRRIKGGIKNIMAFDFPTNFTIGTNQTGKIVGIGSMFQYASYATNGWFGLGLLAMIFVMSFSVSALMNIGRAFASASFITFVFSVYFARIDMVTPTMPFTMMILVIIGFFWARGERGSY